MLSLSKSYNEKPASVSSNHLGKAQYLMAIEQTLNNFDFGFKDASMKIQKKTNNVINSNQCNYASSHTSHLKTYLKVQSGEKPNKCNQCDFASSEAGNLRTHLKIHTGEKSNKCSQCDFASSQAANLKRHLKTHTGEKPNKCNQCDYASIQAGHLGRHMKTHNLE